MWLIKRFYPQGWQAYRAMEAGRHTHWADILYFSASSTNLVVRQPEETAPTITTQSFKDRVLSERIIKQITPEATAILQSFPDYYILPQVKTLAQRIIGNAVPPLLAKALGQAILKSIKS